MSHRPYVIAHRGTSGRYPENILPAFQNAIEVGADWIEFDVMTTSDGVVVLNHDSTVDRCTNGTGKVGEMLLAQIKELDAGIRMGEKFAGVRIPTLEEALDFLEGQPVRLCIEIKGETTDESIQTARKTVDILQRRASLQRSVISSFDGNCLLAIKNWEPLLATSLDPDKQDGSYTPWELCQQVLRCHANSMQHTHEFLTAEIVDEAHQHGFSLWTWTTNEPEDMRRVIPMGVDAIMTDYPDVLRQIVDSVELSP
jgi:glycerophosphoryl diester phosphodiesterase